MWLHLPGDGTKTTQEEFCCSPHDEAHKAALVVRGHGHQRRLEFIGLQADQLPHALAILPALHYADMVGYLQWSEKVNRSNKRQNIVLVEGLLLHDT